MAVVGHYNEPGLFSAWEQMPQSRAGRNLNGRRWALTEKWDIPGCLRAGKGQSLCCIPLLFVPTPGWWRGEPSCYLAMQDTTEHLAGLRQGETPLNSRNLSISFHLPWRADKEHLLRTLIILISCQIFCGCQLNTGLSWQSWSLHVLTLLQMSRCWGHSCILASYNGYPYESSFALATEIKGHALSGRSCRDFEEDPWFSMMAEQAGDNQAVIWDGSLLLGCPYIRGNHCCVQVYIAVH